MEYFERYLEAKAEAFADWLEIYFHQTPSGQEELFGENVVRLHPVHRKPSLFRALNFSLDGETENQGIRQRLALISVTVWAVGKGDRTVVRGMSHDVAANPCLLQLLYDMTTNWPPATREIYLSRGAKKRHGLVELRLNADLQSFEDGLKQFASAYQDEHVEWVAVSKWFTLSADPGQPIDRKGRRIDWGTRRSWDIQLSLRRDGPMAGD